MAWEGSQLATTVVNSGGTGGDVPATDQSRKRSYARYTDQHGRPWGAVIENNSGDPCGPLEPDPSWKSKAPWIPDSTFITIDSQQRKFYIRYEDIILDLMEANQTWETSLRELAVKMYGAQAPTAITNPPPELLDIIGDRPNLKREVVEAAAVENKWILGLADRKPQWAEQFFPKEDEDRRSRKVEITNKYPDADEEEEEVEAASFPAWSGPTKGWKLSDGSYVDREPGEDTDTYKARAQKAQAELEE